jgi:hypothetical protein
MDFLCSRILQRKSLFMAKREKIFQNFTHMQSARAPWEGFSLFRARLGPRRNRPLSQVRINGVAFEWAGPAALA